VADTTYDIYPSAFRTDSAWRLIDRDDLGFAVTGAAPRNGLRDSMLAYLLVMRRMIVGLGLLLGLVIWRSSTAARGLRLGAAGNLAQFLQPYGCSRPAAGCGQRGFAVYGQHPVSYVCKITPFLAKLGSDRCCPGQRCGSLRRRQPGPTLSLRGAQPICPCAACAASSLLLGLPP